MRAPFFHPHLIPVTITNPGQLRELAIDMKKMALREPDDEAPEYSKNMEEVIERQKEVNKDEEKFSATMRHTRFIEWNGHICTLCLTLDEFEEPKMWHLSMCEQRPDPTTELGIRHVRMPDKVSQGIANTMLGRECEEIANRTGISETRHFVIETRFPPESNDDSQ